MIFNYIQVSTQLQNTDRQLLGVECDREFVEKVSGKDTNRTELQKLLGTSKNHPIWDNRHK